MTIKNKKVINHQIFHMKQQIKSEYKVIVENSNWLLETPC